MWDPLLGVEVVLAARGPIQRVCTDLKRPSRGQPEVANSGCPGELGFQINGIVFLTNLSRAQGPGRVFAVFLAFRWGCGFCRVPSAPVLSPGPILGVLGRDGGQRGLL